MDSPLSASSKCFLRSGMSSQRSRSPSSSVETNDSRWILSATIISRTSASENGPVILFFMGRRIERSISQKRGSPEREGASIGITMCS